MRFVFFAVLCFLVVGCGDEKSAEKPKDPNSVGFVSEIYPLADGGAYISTTSGDDVWFVSGQRKTKVKGLIEKGKEYSITAMADGTAILESGGKIWRLKGSEATPVTDNGEDSKGEPMKLGFMFSQWQKERGLTESDRAIHIQEMEDDARGYEDR